MSQTPNATLPEEYILKLRSTVLELEGLYLSLPEKIAGARKIYDAALLFAPPGFDPERSAQGSTAPAATTCWETSHVLQAELVEPAAAPESTAGQVGWRQAILNVLSDSDRPLTHKELLTAVRARYDLPPSEGEKAYYNAVSRLTQTEAVVKHGSHLYTAAAYEDARVRGSLPEVSARRAGGSPELILHLLRDYPEGLSAPRMRELFSSMPEAPRSLWQHGQYIYNILGTLVGLGKVERDDSIYRLAREDKS